VPALLASTATVLAREPGQACLVSLVGPGGGRLRPVVVAHERASTTRALQRHLVPGQRTAADAFSRAVQRSRGALRMRIPEPDMLRLWLPNEYLPYAEQAAVSGVLAVALIRQTHVLGTLLLWREHGRPPFAEAEQDYVSELAARVALAI
jgi:GAF domain-containing protein